MAWQIAARCAFIFLVTCPATGGAESLEWLKNVTGPNFVHYSARIVERVPHDPEVFSQGITFDGESLWESSGRYGQSKLLRYRFDRPIRFFETSWTHTLAPDEFAEGLTILDGMLYQLTWKAGIVHRYRLQHDEVMPVAALGLDRQGWGLTTDGQNIISSDGSDSLVFRSPEDFSAVRAIQVRIQGRSLARLNELEFIDGAIWANIWRSALIAVIDPDDGRVTALIDCSALVEDAEASGQKTDVLNGIAFDPVTQSIYLTGKLWPWIYRIELVTSG
jgi:glutamine cyclotransferase